ncbi:MAG: hypothetical protein RMY28_021235 [Nostoc sp. ChiSLP01]|nr:hypothetical protein [Nostoc sp. CmiSLP01]MDZ8288099.1 hypothetical protein [Nostoc sp. ChiSLP01]
MPDTASRHPAGSRKASTSRETLSAIAHGGNPQDRVASPRRWLSNVQFFRTVKIYILR